MNNRPMREDLEGNPAVNALFMRCGVCQCGDLVGVDLVDREGAVIAHGHLELDAAMEFHRMFGDAINEVAGFVKH